MSFQLPNPMPHPDPPIIHMPRQHAPLEQLLGETTHRWHGYVADKLDLLAWRQEILDHGRMEVDQSPEGEYDFPMTPEEESELARHLFEAMVDFSNTYEERGGKKSFQVERLKKVSDIAMEIMAWDILSNVQDLYFGYSDSVTSLHGKVKYKPFSTFGARFRAIVDACREHKGIVYNLFAQSPVQKLASNPLALVGIKTTNAKINGGRAEEKRRGKEALKKLGEAGHKVISGRVAKK